VELKGSVPFTRKSKDRKGTKFMNEIVNRINGVKAIDFVIRLLK